MCARARARDEGHRRDRPPARSPPPRSFSRTHGGLVAQSLHVLVGDCLPPATHTATALIAWTFGGVLSLAVPHDVANWRRGTAAALAAGVLRALDAACAGEVGRVDADERVAARSGEVAFGEFAAGSAPEEEVHCGATMSAV